MESFRVVLEHEQVGNPSATVLPPQASLGTNDRHSLLWQQFEKPVDSVSELEFRETILC